MKLNKKFLTASLVSSIVSLSVATSASAKASEAVMLEGKGCELEQGLKSTANDQPTSIEIKNESDSSIIIRWIDYEGVRSEMPSLIIRLDPQESTFHNTFVTHPHLITDENGNCLTIFFPAAEHGLALLK